MAIKWPAAVWKAVVSVFGKRKGAGRFKRLLKRLVMLPELTEDQQIANLDHFLKTGERLIKQMRDAGAPDADIQQVVVQLMLPAALAQRDALIAKRLVCEPEKISAVPEVTIYPLDTPDPDEADPMASEGGVSP